MRGAYVVQVLTTSGTRGRPQVRRPKISAPRLLDPGMHYPLVAGHKTEPEYPCTWLTPRKCDEVVFWFVVHGVGCQATLNNVVPCLLTVPVHVMAVEIAGRYP